MPGGNRRISRTLLRNSVPPVIANFSGGDNAGTKYSPLGAPVPTLPGVDQPAPPKHFLFPNTPMDSDLFFEVLMLLYGLLAMALQYLHLYRTVWWLPHSYTKHTMNFYLIDVHLVALVLILHSRRLIYLIGCKLLDKVLLSKFRFAYFCFRLFLFGVICGALSVHIYHITQQYHSVNLFYLFYPVSIYVILFGFRIAPFFDLYNWASSNMPPLHACTTNAVDIRNEVEKLKADFNNRLKQVLFSAVMLSYYSGFFPCVFAPNFLNYDVFWGGQHTVFIFISAFVAHSSHLMHLRYCDILHRSALHLGLWYKLDPRNSLAYHWTEDMLWPANTVARFKHELYRSQAECNAAQPGNSSSVRFYMFFKNPSTPLSFIVLIHVITVLYQLVLLIRATYWYNIVSLTFMLFFNYYLLYKVVRDYLVSYKIYKEEKLVHDKINSQ